ncbi:MAG: hypothetical protein Rubg2KO_26510 [Rubricoccaceae bacterium]
MEAVEAGNTEAAVDAVQAVFERAGVEFQAPFGWDLKPYDEPLNFYDTATKRVTLGQAPTASETSAYWKIYSDRLTAGAWRAEAFFASSDEARILASFNQAYLAAHEAGHALAYHYAVNPAWDVVSEDPYMVSVHCQELLADRVAAAFLSEVIQSVSRADAYRERYLELMASIDAQIPEERRLRLSSLDACSEIPVLHPQDEATFQSYVSAFFARQRLLLSDRQLEGARSELAEVLDDHILWRRATFVADAPDLPGTRVTTLSEPRGFQAPTSSRGGFPFLLEFERSLLVDIGPTYDPIVEEGTAYALLEDGRVHVVTSTATLRIDSLSAMEPPYSNADLIAETTLHVDGEAARLPGLGSATMAVVQSAAALADGDLLALVAVVDAREEAEDAEVPSALLLIRLRRQGGVWQADVGEPFPRSEDYYSEGPGLEDILCQPSGQRRQLDGAVFVESAGSVYSVELATLMPTGEGQPINPMWGDLQALDSEGRRISVLHDVVGEMLPYGGRMGRHSAGGIVIRSDADGAVTLAGSGLALHRDGLGSRAHIGWIAAMRATDDGILLVERGDEMRVRRIRLSQP